MLTKYAGFLVKAARMKNLIRVSDETGYKYGYLYGWCLRKKKIEKKTVSGRYSVIVKSREGV